MFADQYARSVEKAALFVADRHLESLAESLGQAECMNIGVPEERP
jgi:hypothetical protein